MFQYWIVLISASLLLSTPMYQKYALRLCWARERKTEKAPSNLHESKIIPFRMKLFSYWKRVSVMKWTLEALRYYLRGTGFFLLTDHCPLAWINQTWDGNDCITRLYLVLQPFKYTISPWTGTKHINADHLFRLEIS